MKHSEFVPLTFIPGDVLRIIARIKKTWTKLTDADAACYLEGNRAQLLSVLQMKYTLTKEQADNAVSCIERLT